MRVHHTAGTWRALWLGVALVVVLGVSLATRPAPAEAHALLVRSDPAHDARLRAAPPRVTAWFNEPLEAGISTLRVVDGSGGRVDQGQTELDARDPTRMSVALRPDAGPGFYTVTWETLSRIDGHIWFGSFDFTVLNPDGSLPSGPRPSVAAVSTRQGTGAVESALTKLGQLLGAVMLAGGLAFALVVARPAVNVLPNSSAVRVRAATDNRLLQLALLALVLLALAGAAELVLQARSIGGIGEVGTVLGFTWGERWLLRQVLLGGAAAAIALFARARTRG
ncbi:MAG: copper resistance CopC family protein, partial [Dehalococcoidia bacterium]